MRKYKSSSEGCGWKPIFVEGDDPMTMHKLMAEALDSAIEEIKRNTKRMQEKIMTARVRFGL